MHSIRTDCFSIARLTVEINFITRRRAVKKNTFYPAIVVYFNNYWLFRDKGPIEFKVNY